MCELCEIDPVKLKVAREGNRRTAEALRHLAVLYEDLAAGRVMPHTDYLQAYAYTARRIIRVLVEEYV